jgi:pimeloyl-ACP methyl ester carboxylesterase
MISTVEFPSEDAVLRGRLVTPNATEPTPGIVMGPGFSATSHFEVFERYATAIAEIGIAVLLFDYRGFGLSDGEPRGEINGWRQARDYRSAIRHLRSLGQVDERRVGIWGVSSSAPVASIVAASDPTIAAIVLQVPTFGGELSETDSDGRVFESIRETVINADLESLERTVLGPAPVVSADQLNGPSFLKTLTAFRWFIENGGQLGTEWRNEATLARLAAPAPFEAQVCVPRISAPLLMIVAPDDEEDDPQIAQEVFARASDPKQLVLVDGGHFGVLWPDSAEFRRSAAAQQEFLSTHLVG